MDHPRLPVDRPRLAPECAPCIVITNIVHVVVAAVAAAATWTTGVAMTTMFITSWRDAKKRPASVHHRMQRTDDCRVQFYSHLKCAMARHIKSIVVFTSLVFNILNYAIDCISITRFS